MCDYDPFVRDFEELDEKLPMLAKIIVNRGIDFRQLETEEEPDPDVIRSLLLIMRENLECMSEMTADEVEVALTSLNIACEIVCLTNSGVLKKVGDKLCLSEEIN